MNSDMQALFSGFNAITQAQTRQAMMKRQTAQDTVDEELRRAMLKMQQEQATEAGWQRRENDTARWTDRADRLKQHGDTRTYQQQMLKAQIEQGEWQRSPENPMNKLHASQATAVGAKPSTPIGAQLQGVDEFSEEMAKAMAENQAAITAAQSGDPTAQPRALKAQLKLSALQQVGQQMLKTAKPTSIVKIKRSTKNENGDDGVTEELEVPADQWNEQHPAWKRFSVPTAAGTGGPALSTQDQQALQWARTNPRDPRAAQILQRLKLAQ